MKPIFRTILKVLVAGVVACIIGSLGFIYWIGAWGIVFPSHAHESVPPQIPEQLGAPALLVFSKTNSFRHKEGIPAGLEFFTRLAAERGWSVFHTENSAVFNPEDLQRFEVVISLHTSGDTHSEVQRAAFTDWLQAGGAWLGIHSAGDDSHRDWSWYVQTLIGAEFIAHPMDPQFQVATVNMEIPDHPIVAGVTASWSHEDEWYSWKASPRGESFVVLATIDESSYSPYQKMFGNVVDLHMGDHPVIWGRCVGAGRSVYSALGHTAASWEVSEHQAILSNSLDWLLSRTDQPCTNFLQ